jgi:hypothetical protein
MLNNIFILKHCWQHRSFAFENGTAGGKSRGIWALFLGFSSVAYQSTQFGAAIYPPNFPFLTVK